MKEIYSTYPKELLPSLPTAAFPGRIVVVQSEGEAEKAVDCLLAGDMIGVDTETKPSFRKGENNKVALLQASLDDVCFLFRIGRIGMVPPVLRLLENTSVPMVGLSLRDDILSLKRRCSFSPGMFIDLQDVAGSIGIADKSLQKMYANLMGMKISKRQQLSNWNADVLSDKQKLYAATDAWACLQMYRELAMLNDNGEYRLIG